MTKALPSSLMLLALSLLAAGATPAEAAVVRGIVPFGSAPPSVGPLQVLSGHLRPAITRAPVVGVLPPWKTLHLAIGLPLRNRGESTALAAAVANPTSRFYHHYLTPAQYVQRFSPPIGDYQSVIAFAQASHFTVTRTYPNRMIVDVDASVAAIEQAFHLTLQTRVRPDGSVFYAPSNEPAVALQTPLLHIAGLDNERIPTPQIASLAPLHGARTKGRHAQPDIGSGPGGTFAGPDFHNAYAAGLPQNGTSQCIGLLEFDSTFFPSDIAAYQSAFGLPPIVPQTVLLDGYSGVPVVSKGEQETALDIEVAQAMAPGVFDIVMYEGSNPDDMMAAMASSISAPLCNQLSASWTFGIDATTQQILEQMALQGQSFFVSSGDAGGFTSDTGDDRDLSDLVVVGGTELQMDDRHRWSSEVAWPGSSGGIETSEFVPPFQQGVKVGERGSALKQRAIPDVAMVAANTFLMADNGKTFSVTGTSISSPLWAAYTSLINQQALAVGQPPVGYPNPALYAVARKPALYAANFHDIVSGNNGPFSALPGYDLVTGWGSPRAALVSTLNPAPTLNFTQLQIAVYTGSDDLRPDSDLQIGFKGVTNLTPFCLMRSNNGAPSGTCTGNVFGDKNGTQGWPSWSTQVLTYTNRFANWKWAGSGTMTLTLTSHNSGFETNDNWDIQAMSVVLSNPALGTSVTLFDVGDFGAPHNSGTCYWRFKPTGSPPKISVTLNLLPGSTPSDGCPDD